MDEAHMVIAGREKVRTPVTHGKYIRHPHTSDEIDLSMLNLLICDNTDMQKLNNVCHTANVGCHASGSKPCREERSRCDKPKPCE